MPKFKINPVVTCYPPTEEVEAESLNEAETIIGNKYNELINSIINEGKLPSLTEPSCYGIEEK